MSSTPAILGAKVCQRCHQLYMGTNRRKFCDVCKVMQMRDSDRACSQRQQDYANRDHLTEAQVEAVYQAALRQIRRERKHEADTNTSQAWKYTEPGR